MAIHRFVAGAGLVLALTLLISTSPARACRFEAVPLKDSVAKADKVFVGTVETVEVGLVIIKVENGIKNARAGEEVTTDLLQDRSSCAIRFQPGQRWLYLGPHQPDGSLLLQDEYGRDVAANIAAATAQFGAAALTGGERVEGTAADTCAPWDGSAFGVQLGGLGVTAYVSRRTIIDALSKGGVVTYPADNKGEAGHASIVQCSVRTSDGTAQAPCKALQGSVTFSAVDAKGVTGNVDISDGEHNSLIVFKAKLQENRAICG